MFYKLIKTPKDDIGYGYIGADALRVSDRKEQHFYRSIAAVNYDGKKIVDIRFYQSNNGQTNYCCVWVNNRKVSIATSGNAKGYGYHKPSAALSDALDRAGFEWRGRYHESDEWSKYGALSGVGDSGIEAMVQTLAKRYSFGRKFIIVKAYG